MTLNTHQLIKQDGSARLGNYTTLHGSFETPNFMPVGTKASVKGVDVQRLKDIGTQITLVNTYHLWLRPGPELIEKFGGIHKFCGWSGPILSDSGGFQIYSLKAIRKLEEEGVTFKSHLDGKTLFLSPEKAIQIQEAYGVDVAMVLDECPDATLSWQKISESLDRTLRWSKRCLEARRKQTAIFGITQGALYPDLRQKSAEVLAAQNFDGLAIGGLSVGETTEQMYEVLSYHVNHLPKDKIRYLMGVGTPQDITEAVYRGIDLFDCVMPTRSGRFGRAFVSGDQPYINVKNSQYALLDQAIDPNCDCFACRTYSLAYVHHLFKVGEMLGPQLLSIHNLRYYLRLMKEIRTAIKEDRYDKLHQEEQRRWKNFRITA